MQVDFEENSMSTENSVNVFVTNRIHYIYLAIYVLTSIVIVASGILFFLGREVLVFNSTQYVPSLMQSSFYFIFFLVIVSSFLTSRKLHLLFYNDC